MALKTMSAYLADWNEAPAAQGSGSDWYSMYPGQNAGDAVLDTAKVTTNAVSTVQQCLDACTAENLCAGVIFSNASQVAVLCTLIIGSHKPGSSRRTLIKARFANQYSPGCPAGYKVSTNGSVCEACPEGTYW
jgi:hypothetical protein